MPFEFKKNNIYVYYDINTFYIHTEIKISSW